MIYDGRRESERLQALKNKTESSNDWPEWVYFVFWHDEQNDRIRFRKWLNY